MITIFNGRRRTPADNQPDIYIQVSVALRSELHRFWNGRNANAYLVFSALALHANQDGWAWPSFDTLRRETGISREETITAALKWLLIVKIHGQPVLRVYRRVEGGRFVGNVYHIFPEAGGNAARPFPGSQIFPWEPDPDEPGLAEAGPAHPGLKKNSQSLEAEPAIAAGAAERLPALHITVPEGPKKARDSYAHWCQHCGEAITQAHDACPGCQTPVIWQGSAAASRRAKARARQAADARARSRREQESYLSPLTAEILSLARADSVGERHGFRISYNRESREEQRLADYERAYGAEAVRRLAQQVRQEAKGRGLIVALLRKLEAYVPPKPKSPATRLWDDDYYTD